MGIHNIYRNQYVNKLQIFGYTTKSIYNFNIAQVIYTKSKS